MSWRTLRADLGTFSAQSRAEVAVLVLISCRFGCGRSGLKTYICEHSLLHLGCRDYCKVRTDAKNSLVHAVRIESGPLAQWPNSEKSCCFLASSWPPPASC